MNPSRKRKRDEYGTYSPEMRLKMAKSCIEHGPSKTARTFSEELGRQISESTVRSMRNTFLSNPQREHLKTAMPTLTRGRPMKLVYDLVASSMNDTGNSINSSIGIKDACDIVQHKNKLLLRENAGDLDLNKKCAKSLMKQKRFSNRIGKRIIEKESIDFDNSSFIQQVLDTEAQYNTLNSVSVNCNQTRTDLTPYGIVKVEAEEDYNWQPPSEAEMKIIQARRERSDKISKLMGDYLLKGYKMLGSSCHECSTILLQDKQGANYCIACSELDTDTEKDDPVLNSAAARSQMLEASAADEDDTDDLSYMMRAPAPLASVSSSRLPQPEASAADATSTASATVPKSQIVSIVSAEFNPAVEVLRGKIRWATDELKSTKSVDYSITLCQMIKNAADAIQSLKNAS